MYIANRILEVKSKVELISCLFVSFKSKDSQTVLRSLFPLISLHFLFINMLFYYY